MGARGPLPRRRPAAASKLLRRLPGPPGDLREAGQLEWQRGGADLLARRVLTAVSLGTLHDLARAADDAAFFRAKWRSEGATVESAGRPFPSPAVQSEREAVKLATSLRRELGLTPASAARVPSGAPAPDREDRRLDDLLGHLSPTRPT